MPWGVPGCENVELHDWLGNFQRGDVVPLCVQAIDKNSQSSLPTTCPTYQIFDSSGQEIAAATKLPICDRYRFDTAGEDFNYFQHSILMDSSYGGGYYMALIRYVIGGVGYRVTRSWYLDASGDADGAVLSLDRASRPEADYVVYNLRRNVSRAGRNPH